MARKISGFFLVILFFQCFPSECLFFIVPEDVPTALVGIYGFAPRIATGGDHRFGFGFRFGNHADFQLLYEFGPQGLTRPLQPIRTRSASYRERIVRRRPLLELLLGAGLLHDSSYRLDVIDTNDEPR